jgi:hypothetical protein
MFVDVRGEIRWLLCLLLLTAIRVLSPELARGEGFQAGAYAVDISPTSFPVLVNGGFFSRTATRVVDPVFARWIVLRDANTQIAICVVDTCVIPRELADAAKLAVEAETGIPANRILISATHTHAAPSLMQAHGTDRDPHYPSFLVPRLVEGAVRAQQNLVAARAGWTTIQADQHTYCRRWIRRPDRWLEDPFGRRSVMANMHPGHCNPDAVGPAGPVDTGLTVLALQTRQGAPLALLANYSMHYFGAGAVSADYYGRFAAKIEEKLSDPENSNTAPLVGIMSQGTSGDLQWMDYSQPRRSLTYDQYAEELAVMVQDAYREIQFREDITLAMLDRDLELNMRVPDEERMRWAEATMNEFDGFAGGRPKTRPQIYAREQYFLQQHPRRAVKLQALRIGDLSIAAISAEVFGITGLKLKRQSPLETHMNFSLANGEDGYIPPPEQHDLGGYTTWEARTAGLEIDAEPKIVAELLNMLEEVSGKKRRTIVATRGPYVEAVLEADPLAYWRLGEMEGLHAVDDSGHNRAAVYEGGHAFFLPGPQSPAFSGERTNRCVQFVGGRLKAQLADLAGDFSLEMWFWSGLPNTLRAVTGTLLSLSEGNSGGRLIITGVEDEVPGRLTWVDERDGDACFVPGSRPVRPAAWNHVVLVRQENHLRVFLNGEVEIAGDDAACLKAYSHITLADGPGAEDGFHGRLDEVALFGRALDEEEIARHFLLADLDAPPPMPIPQTPSSLRIKPRSLKYREAILESNPIRYWPLYETDDTRQVADLSPQGNSARLEPAAGPLTSSIDEPFQGGRLHATVPRLKDTWSLEFWFRNSLSNTSRAVTAYLASRGPDGAEGAPGDHVGIGGTHTAAGRLFFFNGNRLNQLVLGVTEIPPGTWNHVVLVRDGRAVRLYLNGHSEPEFAGEAQVPAESPSSDLFLGGRNDNFANLQGAIEDVSVYDRALTPEEVTAHFAAMEISSR